MALSTSWGWLALGFGAWLVTGCDEDDILVVQNTRPIARIYEEQARGWNQWALGEPHTTGSPIADPTGERCDVSQEDGVWYLAGTFGGPVERTCSIPADQYLYFPLVNRFCIEPDATIDDEKAMAALVEFGVGYFAANRAATCELTLRLDGDDLLSPKLGVLDHALYTDVLKPFETDIDPDNWATQFGFDGGPTPMITDGHYALLNPLLPGDHVLEFGGTLCNGDDIDFETFATYHLTVEGD
jgi:hypothetical protein